MDSDAPEDSLERFPAYLVSPGYVACVLREDYMRPLRDPRSLELTVDGNFRAEGKEGRSELALSYWQLVHELPRRFQELSGTEFDLAAWHAALAEHDDLPLVYEEGKPPFSLPFTRGGETVAELLAVFTWDWGLGDYYYDNNTLCLRYAASEEDAAWQLIRSLIDKDGIEYHALQSVEPWRSPWWW